MNKIIIMLVSLLLISCSSPSLNDYQQSTPKFALDKFYNGQLTAHGVVFDRNGKMLRRFSATLNAHWQGNQGTIDEQFVFDDGEKTTRTWQLKKLADGSYSGTAGDVVGTAKGRARGSVFYWQYALKVPVNGDEYVLNLDDWMYLLDEHSLLNKTTMTKYGIKVGELVIYIEKQ